MGLLVVKDKLKVVSRKRWKALPPKETEPLHIPAQRMDIKYTGHDPCINKEDCIKVMQEMQKQAMDQGMPDIAYNFVIGGDARIYEGRGWKTLVRRPDIEDWRVGTMTLGYIGKEFIDTYMTERLIESGYKLLHFGQENSLLIVSLQIDDEDNILIF